MNSPFTGHKEDFVMFLPDDLPLISYHTQFYIYVDNGVSAFTVITTIDYVSIKNLVKAQLFPYIDLPEIDPLTKLELKLDLIAKPSLRQYLGEILLENENPIDIIIKRKGTEVPPFRYISNYTVESWAFIQTPLASAKFIELAKKPPHPL